MGFRPFGKKKKKEIYRNILRLIKIILNYQIPTKMKYIMSFSSIFEEKVFWIPDKVLYNPMDQTL